MNMINLNKKIDRYVTNCLVLLGGLFLVFGMILTDVQIRTADLENKAYYAEKDFNKMMKDADETKAEMTTQIEVLRTMVSQVPGLKLIQPRHHPTPIYHIR